MSVALGRGLRKADVERFLDRYAAQRGRLHLLEFHMPAQTWHVQKVVFEKYWMRHWF